MRIQDIMTRNVKTIGAEVSAEEAWHMMSIHDIRHLIVVKGKLIVGILSQRDLGGENGFSLCEGRQVVDLMHTDVVLATPEMTIKDAANLMRGHIIGCLPVVEDGKLVGVLTTSDLLELLGQGFDRKLTKNKRQPEGVDMPSYTRSQH